MTFVYRILILAAMLFLHLFADYNLQGDLSKLKQREWWRKSTVRHIYDNDYKMALFEHAFAWSFVMSLPLLVIAIADHNIFLAWIVVIGYLPNTLIHAAADDWKANLQALNLTEDQTIHIVQILLTWIVAMGAI